MTVETETQGQERVYDRTLVAGAKRLGAWGPGFLTKSEGLWQTPHGVYVIAERAAGDERVSFRLVEEAEATEALRAHGQSWRAGQIERSHAPEDPASDDAPDDAGPEAPATGA